jgi:hypothetical protein
MEFLSCVCNPADFKARMPNRSRPAVVALVAAAFLAGCAQMTVHALPNADVGHFKHIFVEHRLADSYGVADEVARQLRAMGYDASAGALTMLPDNADLIVSYADMWTWDFNTYMIEFDMQVRMARSDRILAVGHYYKPAMVFGRPPRAMIQELLVKLFKHA